jgi:hypothetical protein
MPASQKIITKLRERRQIEADLRQMLRASSELEFQRQAQRIASLGSQVIPTIVGNLDRADARMLTAMGTVATFLDEAQVTSALHQAVLQPQQTDRARIGAMTILERFLGQQPDDSLLASLRDPEGMAISSLEEVLSQVEQSPAILIQYIEQLDQQEPDIVLAVVRSLRDMGAPSPAAEQRPQAVEPLRMMAQDVREEIAAEALQALGTIRLPEAARALQTLIPITAPTLRLQAERLLRKLQFSGVPVSPLPPPEPHWRALISPVNEHGQQSVWFLQRILLTEYSQFLNVLLSDRAGAVMAIGHSQVPGQILPRPMPAGYLHDIAQPDGSGAMLMLEADFDLGRRLVVESLVENRRTQIPVAGPLRLLSSRLWGYAGADSLPTKRLPALDAADQALVAVSDRLLEHPAFVTWTTRSESTFRAAAEALGHPGWDLEVWVRRLTGELLDQPETARMLSRRLESMSEWLLLAGDESRAGMALAAARAMPNQPPQEQPFLRALVRRDLNVLLQSLQGFEPVSGTEQ